MNIPFIDTSSVPKEPRWMLECYDESFAFLEEPFCWTDAYIMREYNIGLHEQTFWEINIILNGEGIHYIEDQQFPVSVGDVFVIPANTRHAYTSTGKFDVYHIILSKQFFSQYSAELNAIPCYHTLFNVEPALRSSGSYAFHLSLHTDEFTVLSPLLEQFRLYTNIVYETPHTIGDRISAISYALVVLTKLCGFYEKRINGPLSDKLAQKDLAFLKSVSEIYNNFGGDLSTEQLAAIAGRSRSSYIEHFKRILHMPPGQFILKYRLEKAQELIISTNTPISQIAAHCGFYDLSHFEKSFLRTFGISPSAMRNGELPIKK